VGRHGAPGLLPVLLLLAACGSGSGDLEGDDAASGTEGPETQGSPVVVVDHRGDTVSLPRTAVRIVSLVPSVTQTLQRIGATRLLVARTDYDTLSAIAHLPSVGGGLGPNLEVLSTLEPDVVITFAGESDLRTSQGLAALEIPEVAVRPDRLIDVPAIVRMMGVLSGREAQARALVAEIQAELEAVSAAVERYPTVRAAYLLGGSPPLAAGPGTFISDLLERAGGRNVLQDLDGLYSPVSPEVLRLREVDVLLTGEASSLDPRLTRGRRVAEIPSWVEVPGPDLGKAAWIVARALHPALGGGTS
jgi:ABC-type Fe3+-hydroxamate transport system substrate-binding protein